MIAAGHYGRWRRYAGWCLFVTLATVFTLQFVPDHSRMFGISLLATVVVWVALVRLAWGPVSHRPHQSPPALPDAPHLARTGTNA